MTWDQKNATGWTDCLNGWRSENAKALRTLHIHIKIIRISSQDTTLTYGTFMNFN